MFFFPECHKRVHCPGCHVANYHFEVVGSARCEHLLEALWKELKKQFGWKPSSCNYYNIIYTCVCICVQKIKFEHIYIYIYGHVICSKKFKISETEQLVISRNWLLILPIAGASSSRIAAASTTSPLYSYLLKNTGFGDVWWHIPGNFCF